MLCLEINMASATDIHGDRVDSNAYVMYDERTSAHSHDHCIQHARSLAYTQSRTRRSMLRWTWLLRFLMVAAKPHEHGMGVATDRLHQRLL